MFILDSRAYVGKFDALEAAARAFPSLRCWDYVWEILGKSYETPRWYEDAAIDDLEDSLEEALNEIAEALRGVITLIPREVGVDIGRWKQSLASIHVNPGLEFFDQVKFSRLMKGRLLFYGNAPDHFESTWLIRNELARIGRNFFSVPFRILWRILGNGNIDSPIEVIDELRGDLLCSDEIEAVKAFHRLTADMPPVGKEKSMALQVADVFDDYYAVLSKVGQFITTAGPTHLRDPQQTL